MAGLGVLGFPNWVLPALAQGAVVIPFLDIPEDVNFEPTPERRSLDVRRIDGAFTPADQFFTLQHYGQPVLEGASHRLTVSGLVDRSLSLSLDDLRQMGGVELAAGFECSGNRPPLQGNSSNGLWTGVPLRTVLERAGAQAAAREVVFFGADSREEEMEWRRSTFSVNVRFGRSLPREHALSAAPFLAYALNGDPLTRHQGFPLRLIVPGWYGVANVKWLTGIEVQHERYVGKWQTREYRTIKGEMVDGEMRWNETAIGAMRLKSFLARVTREGGAHKVLGWCSMTVRRCVQSKCGWTTDPGRPPRWIRRRRKRTPGNCSPTTGLVPRLVSTPSSRVSPTPTARCSPRPKIWSTRSRSWRTTSRHLGPYASPRRNATLGETTTKTKD